MKYILLLNQRINISVVAHYYPQDSFTSPNISDYVIKFIFSGGATLTLQYSDKQQRDKDIKTLDNLCVSNKNIK